MKLYLIIAIVAQWVKNPTSTPEVAGSTPGLTKQVKDLSCGIDHRCNWVHCCDWCRPEAAPPIQPLAWELPYTTRDALKLYLQEFTGGLVITTQLFHHYGLGSILGLGNELPHQAPAHHSQKEKEKKKKKSKTLFTKVGRDIITLQTSGQIICVVLMLHMLCMYVWVYTYTQLKYASSKV